MVSCLLGRRRPAGGERPARAQDAPAACPVRLHPLQPVRRRARAADSPRTSPIFCPTICPERRSRLLDALAPDLLVFSKLDLWPELATRADAARRDRGHRRGDGEPRKRPAALARAPAAPARVCRGHRRRRDRRRRREPAGAAGRARGTDPRPGRSAIRQRGRQGSRGRRRTIHCCASDAAHPLSWPAPPGRPTKRCSSKPSRRLRARRADARLILVPHEPTAAHLAALESDVARRRPSRPRTPQRCGGAGPAARGGSGRRAGRDLRRRDDGLCRRRVRAGRSALGAGAGGLGTAGRVRTARGGRAGMPACCSRQAPRSHCPEAVPRKRRPSCARAGSDGSATSRGERNRDRKARAVVEQGLGAARRSAEMLAELISSRPLRTSQPAAR